MRGAFIVDWLVRGIAVAVAILLSYSIVPSKTWQGGVLVVLLSTFFLTLKESTAFTAVLGLGCVLCLLALRPGTRP